MGTLGRKWSTTIIVGVLGLTTGSGTLHGATDSAPVDSAASTAPGLYPGSIEPGSLANEADEQYSIIMLSASDVIPGWHGYNIGAQAAADALGVDFEIVQWASLEPNDLAAGVNAVVARNPDAALFSAVNDQALQAAFESAADAGPTLVGFDSPPVDDSVFASYVGSPAAKMGAITADLIASLVGGEGVVLQTDAAPGFSTLVVNQEAFRDRMESAYPDIELLPLEWDDGDVATNASIRRATLARHPDLAGAYLGTSGLGGRGGVIALQEAGLAGEVPVVTLDGLPAAIQDLRDGTQAAVTSVRLYDVGWLAVEAAVASLNGDEVPANIESGYCILTGDNVDDPEVAESFCVYPSES